MTSRIHDLLERSADRGPQHELLVQQGARHTYAAIDAAANHLAATLLARGLSRGDRVGLLARNGPHYVEGYFGILKAGGVVVPINTAADGAMLARYLERSEATTLVVGPAMERLVRGSAAQLEEVRLVIAPHADRLGVGREAVVWERGSADRPRVDVSDGDVATIIFTSGSTGTPRGVTLTHGNVMANVRSILKYLALTEDDRVLQVLPFYYVYGKSVLNTHVAVGGTVVVENRFRYPQVALDTLEQERCTGFSGVPSSFAILLDRTNLTERRLTHLRYVTQAGGAMSPALTSRLIDALPGKAIYVMYGATEASARLSYVPPEELPSAIGSVGRAIDGVELRVLRSDGSECDVDEVGELVARGPNIMGGYWQDPEETARVLDEHGYHTGDLARRDARGLLYVVGRMRDMVKVGGHRISTLEVEDALMADEAVHQCAVIGVEDELLGEQLAAFVVPTDRSEPTPESLAAGLRRRVPAYKIPRTIRLISELPKNESGKIMKNQLASLLPSPNGAEDAP